MAERSGYADGEPCWADVTTPDLDAATRALEHVGTLDRAACRRHASRA